jgi:pimeloyl-ACP methyl ester carboxylesterase
MVMPGTDLVRTDLARLHVRRTGSGPPVVLWHSLFVDSTSWGPLLGTFARHRTVYAIDGPSHGRSETVHRDFTFEELVRAVGQALDRLGLTEPVDWVGNAWGGHIGFRLAVGDRPRVRTLTTIGTPVRGFTAAEKLTKGWPLVEMYRLTGANRFLMRELSRSLLGPQAVAAHPADSALVMQSFASADRRGMFHAMRSMMLHRNGIDDLLPDIRVPTLVLAARDDVMGWRPDEARRTCTVIPDCRVEAVAGQGHVAPLLLDRDRIAAAVTELLAAAD